MSQWKRLLPYILLNIVLSACTTLIVLWLWGRAHELPPPVIDTPAAVLPTAAFLPTGTASATSVSPAQLDTQQAGAVVSIKNVYGVGSLNDEIVLIQSDSGGPVALNGWKLEDGKGNVYTFPPLTLNNNGAVQVHSGAGTDTVIDLYWGRDTPVWHMDDVVTLLDAQGNIRATYQIR